MRTLTGVSCLGVWLLLGGAGSRAQDVKILTNHLGYDAAGAKHAVIVGGAGDKVGDCALKEAGSSKPVLTMPAKAVGPVKNWRDWNFWTVDFDAVSEEGRYVLECPANGGMLRSQPFEVRRLLLERKTLSDVIYYFKEERSVGRMDEADRHLPFDGRKDGATLDAHGGWWDATGDYGKHLSHLSFSTYFNPQQIPLVVYSLLKSNEQMKTRGVADFRRYEDRALDEALYGADYLVRVKVPAGSFYRSISHGGDDQVPEQRKVNGEMKSFGIYQSAQKGPTGMVEHANNDLEYEVSYRAGGGMAIAGLAMASTLPYSGEYKSNDYLKAAEDAFEFLEKNNLKLVNDGKENIVDDYCALAAAAELYKATKKERYISAANTRAKNLVGRLATDGGYANYWRADDKSRPFFHASDAGLPVVSLLYYLEIADAEMRTAVLDAVKKALTFQLSVTQEVVNPFGYARQLVQDHAGNRRTRFFFPHDSDAAPWWQGENARLASLAAAARLAAKQFNSDPEFQARLESFAINQLNWILGLNPFDSCMLNGVGRNNPEYLFFDSWEFTNAPGGISNGITSGFRDEEDIDYDLKYRETGADNDWRWQEQWLPHAAWYLLAVSTDGQVSKNVK
jgi:hypothetical protein